MSLNKNIFCFAPILVLISSLFIGCSPDSNNKKILQIEGSANFNERMAIPENTIFEVSLVDITDTTKEVKIIAKYEQKNAAQPPYNYKLTYKKDDIDTAKKYILRAQVKQNNRVLFTTQENYAVINGITPETTSLLLVKTNDPLPTTPTAIDTARNNASSLGHILAEKSHEVGRDISNAGEDMADKTKEVGKDISDKASELAGDAKEKGAAALAATKEALTIDRRLQNTYWKLITAVETGTQGPAAQREPHLILHKDGNRVGGSDGCNTFLGSYEINENTVIFSNIRTTRMACENGKEVAAFMEKALDNASIFTIAGDELQLRNVSTGTVSTFQAVDL